MTAVTIPPGVRVLTESLTINGWSFTLTHSEDYGLPYITLEASRGKDDIRVAWHTQETGTYALRACALNQHDATLTKAMQAVAA